MSTRASVARRAAAGVDKPEPIISNLPNPKDTNISTSKALILVLIIFLSSLLMLGFVYRLFPDLEENERKHVKLPWDLEDAKKLGLVLDRYKEKYFYEVMSAVFLVYILYPFINQSTQHLCSRCRLIRSLRNVRH